MPQVSFGQRWATSVLQRVRPLRKHWPAGLCLMHSGLSNVEAWLNPASKLLMSMCEHELTDMGEVARVLDKKKPLPKVKGKRRRHSVCVGKCGYKECDPKKPIAKAKRSQLRCNACNNGDGQYYHMDCFFKVHRCIKV